MGLLEAARVSIMNITRFFGFPPKAKTLGIMESVGKTDNFHDWFTENVGKTNNSNSMNFEKPRESEP